MSFDSNFGTSKISVFDNAKIRISEYVTPNKKHESHEFELEKVLGSANPADILTEFTDKQTLHKLLQLLNLAFEDGRA